MVTEFTPVASLLGGALIGVASVWLLASTGRIAGISGIVSRLLPPPSSGVAVGIAFVVGLLIAAPLYGAVLGEVQQSVSPNLLLLGGAGLLVGFGSVLGNGCTSGHGVCGLSRLSGRSLVATLTFMATAFVTVYVIRHLVGG